MIPGVFEWIWDLGHVIFIGIFWIVILTFVSGLIYVLGKTISDTYGKGAILLDDYLSDQRQIKVNSPISKD